MSNSIDWKPLEDILSNVQSCVLTTHCRADCDALGSELALCALLESMGKSVRIANGDGVPEHIGFMDPGGRIEVIGEGITPEEVHGADALIVVDTSAWVQLGPMADVLRSFPNRRVVIDHHVSSDDLGAEVFRDATAEATGRLILELMEHLARPLSLETARLLFTAIATDTGWFRFSSVTGKTFRALAKLRDAGASPPEVFSALYEQHSFARLHLRGRVLVGAERLAGGRLMTSSVTQRDFQETGALVNDTEDAINLLLSVAGSEAAALFVELEDGQTKISLRSRGDVDVRAVAERFGGGGHKAAAGVRRSEPIAEARRAVLDAMCEALG